MVLDWFCNRLCFLVGFGRARFDACVLNNMLRKLTAAIATRTTSDIVIPECKIGSSWFDNAPIIDVWTMRKSWVNPAFIGYEIKTSRADFLRDKKWKRYLPACTQFYFVCPHGLIKPNEIEDPAGLLWLTKTENYLRQQKPALHLEINHAALESVLLYILMNRVTIEEREVCDRSKHTEVNFELNP